MRNKTIPGAAARLVILSGFDMPRGPPTHEHESGPHHRRLDVHGSKLRRLRLWKNLMRLKPVVGLVIATSCAALTVVAQPPSSAQLPNSAAFIEMAPRVGAVNVASESCPYQFDSDMPQSTFCVYKGVALDGDGEVCATDIVIMWSTWPLPVGGAPTDKAPGSPRQLYLAFVADPEPVMRAIVDPLQRNRAELVEYSSAIDELPQPLAGALTLRAAHPGSVLNMDLREPRRFSPGGCAFASYAGVFLAVMRPPNGTSISAGSPASP